MANRLRCPERSGVFRRRQPPLRWTRTPEESAASSPTPPGATEHRLPFRERTQTVHGRQRVNLVPAKPWQTTRTGLASVSTPVTGFIAHSWPHRSISVDRTTPAPRPRCPPRCRRCQRAQARLRPKWLAVQRRRADPAGRGQPRVVILRADDGRLWCNRLAHFDRRQGLWPRRSPAPSATGRAGKRMVPFPASIISMDSVFRNEKLSLDCLQARLGAVDRCLGGAERQPCD